MTNDQILEIIKGQFFFKSQIWSPKAKNYDYFYWFGLVCSQLFWKWKVHKGWPLKDNKMVEIVSYRKASSQMQICSSNIHCKPIPCNENRVFPVKFSHREIPVRKTGVPAMRTGVPCNKNRFFPVWKTSQGKPCSVPVLALYGIAVWFIFFATFIYILLILLRMSNFLITECLFKPFLTCSGSFSGVRNIQEELFRKIFYLGTCQHDI